ncbi:MAG TPA: class I SAM-dependent methyltransferase [Bacteroidales bacterium]|nr:class I SAM-dependent methyltransferase [Bacteroidales bacterium]HON21284.1 class I SAM-dependent methyltransferase [Bacteroidales bacterium]HOR82052.1 class I SAM-dependent methyltransferase [Bacteroidales bacterium]HPJ91415.1 class I SAM-dependent methyltransferase [Bacteroidales bacterium]HQB18998.1 class I SAM-dependent methyltransferase [Bacteroidales bacterium]
MHERYVDRKLYFKEQFFTTEKYVIPYINEVFPISETTEVLEIGCGEGGNLQAFLDLQCRCVGIDINEKQIDNAKLFYENHPHKNKIEFIHSDIYKVDGKDLVFDLIIMRDVIEHIPNQEFFMQYVKKFLKPNGVIFFGFPPWQNPFGGHQQVCQSKLSKTPYFHLLPTPLYRRILERFGEDPTGLLEVKATGISIERFHRILRKEKYIITKNDYYFINPNYEIKFRMKPKKVIAPFRWIPYLRNFYTTAYYAVVKPIQQPIQ